MLKKEGGANKEYIESLNVIGRLLCDNESVSRRQLLCLNLNKDFKEALKDSPTEKWLFGSNLDTTLKTTKELEKSTELLKVPKRITGNLKRPFLSRKGTQQSGHKLRVPKSYQRGYPQTKHSRIGQGSRPG
nr:unnamed protein product [Callosobruchus analis]